MEHIESQEQRLMTKEEAFTEMCFESIKAEGLIKGFRQVTKSIISGRSRLVILSMEIDHDEMKTVLENLAEQHGVPVVKIKTHEELAEYVGQCKRGENDVIVKRTRCAAASIENFGAPNRGQREIFSQMALK